MKINFRTYITNFWNLNDWIVFGTYTAFFCLSYDEPENISSLKSLQLVIIISSFIKLCFLIRIFTKLSFLVRMLVNVFYDLRYFLIFFLIVLGMFTVLIQVILKDTSDDYDGVRNGSFFILALRQSVGDYDTSTLIEGSDYKVLVWILWFLIIVIGNIVFMNFIIAVVSESYENCMERMV